MCKGLWPMSFVHLWPFGPGTDLTLMSLMPATYVGSKVCVTFLLYVRIVEFLSDQCSIATMRAEFAFRPLIRHQQRGSFTLDFPKTSLIVAIIPQCFNFFEGSNSTVISMIIHSFCQLFILRKPFKNRNMHTFLL